MTSRVATRFAFSLLLTSTALLGCGGGQERAAVGLTSVPVYTSDPSDTVPASTDPPLIAVPDQAGPPVSGVDFAILGNALDLTGRPGTSTVYVVAKSGEIEAYADGSPRPQRVLTIAPETMSDDEEAGLLGLEFSPDGARAYIHLVNINGENEIDEYEVEADGTFETESRRTVLIVPQSVDDHYGGDLEFGPDGYLYISLGDGASEGDPNRVALDPTKLRGKILRIDPTESATGQAYSIPADNPFVDAQGTRPEIWSLGLRNPWRLSFDRVTGDLWISDVGQVRWEEVNVGWAQAGGGAGSNFGWSAFEGVEAFNVDQTAADAIEPIFRYPHAGGDCSITGGVRYRGQAMPSLVGSYIYADFCTGKIRALTINPDGTAGTALLIGPIVKYASCVCQDLDGELYVVSVTGRVIKLTS